MKKENLVKRLGKGLGKRVIPYVLSGALAIGSLLNYRCADGFVEPEPEKPVTMLAPVAMFIANPTEGDAPLEVSFDGSLSYARTPGAKVEEYRLDADGDGNSDIISEQPEMDYTYEEAGTYNASLKVVDSNKKISENEALETIVVNEDIVSLGQIAFRSFLPFGTIPDCGLCDDIYIMDDNGENLRRLTTNTGEEMEPTWSPDGSRIAYAAISASIGGGDPVNNNNGLFVINFNGTGEEKLYGVEGRPEYTRYPDWSPDGLKIAFTYFFIKENSAEDRNGISVFDLESRVVTQLTSDPCPRCFSNGSPSWSPDGSRIVFDAYRNNSTDIWIMNADGSGEEKIYSGGMMPDWSPDGLEIVFVSPPSEPKIYIMKINDGSIIQITKDPSFMDYQPDWSPDGNRIVFSRGAPGMGLQIYIMNKDGSEQTHFPIPEHSESPAWRPKIEN